MLAPPTWLLCSDPLLPTTDNSYELTGILTGPVAQNPLCVVWRTTLNPSMPAYEFCQVRYRMGHGTQPQQNNADCATWYHLPARLGVYYSFKIQGCNSSGFGTDCTGWTEVDFQCCSGVAPLNAVLATASPVPRAGTGTCVPGYVWRQANAADHVRDTASAKANGNRYYGDRGKNRSNADRSRIRCASVPSRVRLAYG
jgi:hypothetical protein